jgi:hypothetical protein
MVRNGEAVITGASPEQPKSVKTSNQREESAVRATWI